MQQQNTRRTSHIATAILLLAICVSYANSFGNSFHLDDFHTVINNPAIRSLHNVPRFFTDATSFSVLPANQTYRPLVSASLAFDYALGHGYIPFWFHLTTFLLFVLLVWLLSRFYEILFSAIAPSSANFWLALIAAAWFGLHPAIAETVNYVIQRGDLFCTLGCIAALYLFAAHPQQRRYGLYLLPFVAALFSKPPAAVFPALLFLYICYFEHPQQASAARFRSAAIAVLPAIAIDALLLWLQSAMTPKSFTPATISAADYRLTQPFVWLRYFGELWLPVHLNVDTDLNSFQHLNAAALAGIVFVIALIAGIFVCSRRRALYPIAFGLLWFVITQLPTSLYTLSEVENDHRMFFSFAGLIPAAVWALWLLWLRATSPEQRIARRPLLIAAVSLALFCYACGAFARNIVWRDEESLWHDDVLKSPTNGRGLMNYGLTQMNAGRNKIALDYFERALRYTPNYPTLEINLGVNNEALAEAGETSRRAEAERHFLRAIALAPGADESHAFYGRFLLQQERLDDAVTQLKTAIAFNPQTLMPRELLIDAYTQLGDTAAARTLAQQTLAIAPDDIAAQHALAPDAGQTSDYWINLSLTQYQRGQFAQSIASAQHALILNPKSAIAWNNVGAAQGAMHQWPDAIVSEQKAVALDPTLQIAKNNLQAFTIESSNPRSAADFLNDSLTLNQQGRLDESVAAARAALKLDPKMAEAWNNIAADYEGQHRWNEAIDAAQKAIMLKPDFQLAKNNLAWSISQKQLQHGSK
jgi:tetratricopeptide (TPR) repeat protein